MRALVLKIILLSAILTMISILVTSFLPVFWARTDLNAKSTYLQAHSADYNTVFIGASSVFHQIDPVEFDSLARENGLDIHSFNLGIPAFEFPESFRMMEEAVLRNPNVKYVYFELRSVAVEIPEQLVGTPQNYYWYDWEHTSLLYSHIWQSDLVKDEDKPRLLKRHGLALVEKNLFLGGAEVLIKSVAGSSENWILSQCDDAQGYISLDTESRKNPNPGVFKNRRIAFEKDTMILQERRLLAEKYQDLVAGAKPTPYSMFLGDMYRRLQAKGIEVYFIVAPRLKNYEGYREVVSEIPKEKIINLSSPASFPEFYQFDYSFDKGHLNAKGAAVFTRELFDLSLKKR